MPEEQTPNPTLNEGGEESAPKATNNNSLAELQELLESAGIETPTDLKGKLEASQNYYNVSKMLKDERDRNAELQRQLNERQRTPVRPRNTEDDFDLDNYNPGQTVDISNLVGTEVRKAVRNEWNTIQKEQQEGQQRAIAQYGKIRNDSLYSKVGPLFEEKMKDPTFAYEVQVGMRDPVEEYRNLKDAFYQNIIKQAHGTITKLQGGGGTPQQTEAPHVETGERSGNIVSTEKTQTDRDKILEAARSKVKEKGVLDDADELALMDSIFPEPI